MSMIKRMWPVYALVLLGLIGLLDATYLTASHFRNTAVVCSLFEGCDLVLESRYATVFGIPLALFGALYYFLISFGAMMSRILKKTYLLTYISYFTIVGFLASLVLLYIQVWVIEAICQFCIVSAVISTLLFITGMLYVRGKRRGNMTSSLYESETVQ